MSLALTTALTTASAPATSAPPGARGAPAADWPGFAGVPEPGETILFKGSRYFAADDTVHGEELWRTNGTAAGTELFADLTPGDASSDSNVEIRGATDRWLYVWEEWANDLWRTDGSSSAVRVEEDAWLGSAYVGEDRVFLRSLTGPGLHVIADDRNQVSTVSPDVYTGPGAVLDGVLYFAAHDGDFDTELWRSDGTAGGTRRVSDIRPGTGSSAPASFVVAGSKVYFTADDGQYGRELWVTDGTAQGTQRLTDHGPSSYDTQFPVMVAAGSRLYYAPTWPGNAGTLWRTTGDDVRLVKDFTTSNPIKSAVEWRGGIAVWAYGAVWTTAGTAKTTKRVWSWSCCSSLQGPYVADDTLVWWVDGEVWRSDGTPRHTFVAGTGQGTALPAAGGVTTFERGDFGWLPRYVDLPRRIPSIKMRKSPRLVGSARAYSVLRVRTGRWRPQGSVSVSWHVGRDVLSSTSTSIQVPGSVGKKVWATVTVDKVGYPSVHRNTAKKRIRS